MIPFFRKIYTKDQSLMSLQDATASCFNAISQLALLDYVILQDIALTSVAKDVPHGLKRKPIGYIVIKNSTQYPVYSSTESATPELFLKLQSTNNTTVSLLVF